MILTLRFVSHHERTVAWEARNGVTGVKENGFAITTRLGYCVPTPRLRRLVRNLRTVCVLTLSRTICAR
jgi:hypothetical protein